MTAQITIVLAVALIGQAAFAQFGSYYAGNTVVENDIFINGDNAYGLGGLGVSALGLGTGSAGYGLGLGNGLGATSIGLGSANFGLGLGLGNSIGVSGPGLVGASPLGLSIAATPLVVTSISPIGPSGLAVASENVLEGNLLVTGTLPFLSAVAFEGALPTAGSGVATCGCGSGPVGIVSEGFGGNRLGFY